MTPAVTPAPSLSPSTLPASPSPLPAHLLPEYERTDWARAPLVRVEVDNGRTRFPQVAAASHPRVTRAFQFESEVNRDVPLFEHVGPTFETAVTRARERASLQTYGSHNHQAQAVLQAASGAYYVTGLAEAMPDERTNEVRYRPLDIDTFRSAGDAHSVRVLEVHPDVRAIVGARDWVHMPRKAR